MTIDENVNLINKIKIAEGILRRLADQSRNALIMVSMIDVSNNGVYIHRGIDWLAYAMDYSLTHEVRDSIDYPHGLYFVDKDGFRYYQMMHNDEYYKLKEHCAVNLKEEAIA